MKDRSSSKSTSDSGAEAALRERIKELTCLYQIAKLRTSDNASIEELLLGVVGLLPPAWQHPDVALARITMDGRVYQGPVVRPMVQQQSSDIFVRGDHRGTVEVGYTERMPDRDEGPFLMEERLLLDTVAREVGLLQLRRDAEEEKAKAQDQLRHADRLATIGQLAAGFAHELNEPLGSILGFAQLTSKIGELPDQASRDVAKIIRATLHAREIVKNLMLFARQMPPKKTSVDLNRLVHEALELLENRSSQGKVEISRDLAPVLPRLIADRSQLLQVIVNLVVNALQAMPDGGTVALRTLIDDGNIVLSVEDDGPGMSEDVGREIFLPFFTTKDVGEGTGLGLSVVHGIVAAHGGSIRVDSRIGRGTRFDVRIPIRIPDEDTDHG